MDVSKLPKLSDTRAADGAAQTPATDVVAGGQPTGPRVYRDAYAPRSSGVGPDVWISAVLGVLFVGLGRTFASWALSKLTGRPFDTGVTWSDDARYGQVVPYFQVQGYTAWQDAGLFFFGLTLLVEAATKAALALRPGRVTRGLLMVAFALTFFTVVLNLVAVVLIFGFGVTPLPSLLAVAFGGWVLFDVWGALVATRPSLRAGAPSESLA